MSSPIAQFIMSSSLHPNVEFTLARQRIACNSWLAECDLHLIGHVSEPFVLCPQRASVQEARCEEMHINQANASPHESMSLQEQQDLIIFDLGHMRQRMEQGDDLLPVA